MFVYEIQNPSVHLSILVGDTLVIEIASEHAFAFRAMFVGKEMQQTRIQGKSRSKSGCNRQRPRSVTER